MLVLCAVLSMNLGVDDGNAYFDVHILRKLAQSSRDADLQHRHASLHII